MYSSRKSLVVRVLIFIMVAYHSPSRRSGRLFHWSQGWGQSADLWAPACGYASSQGRSCCVWRAEYKPRSCLCVPETNDTFCEQTGAELGFSEDVSGYSQCLVLEMEELWKIWPSLASCAALLSKSQETSKSASVLSELPPHQLGMPSLPWVVASFSRDVGW